MAKTQSLTSYYLHHRIYLETKLYLKVLFYSLWFRKKAWNAKIQRTSTFSNILKKYFTRKIVSTISKLTYWNNLTLIKLYLKKCTSHYQKIMRKYLRSRSPTQAYLLRIRRYDWIFIYYVWILIETWHPRRTWKN